MKKTTLALLLSAILSASATAEESQQQPNIVNITINNVGEESGLEMGTGSRARGTGSIATGKNSVALGKNAVATGGNETQSSINAKLAENKQKLADIATAEANTNRLLSELQNIRKVEADVIEAGERVKQVRLAKQSAYSVWQNKLKTYNDTVAGSAQFLADAQAKIDDLNSRLTGVSRIGNVDISSDEGLTNAATQLKSIAEEGTTLNLSVDFYKDYVSSYYQALGDLRNNKLIVAKSNPNIFAKNYYGTDYDLNVKNIKNPYISLSIQKISYGVAKQHEGMYFGTSKPYMSRDAFFYDQSINAPSADLRYFNPNTDIATEAQWQQNQQLAPEYKAAFKQYFDNTNDPFMTNEVKTAILNAINTKIDSWVKTSEVAYYQGQYEATRNTVWLDKKQQAIKEYDQLIAELNTLPNPELVRQKAIANWKAENIDAVMQRNNITTATLTSELEKALGINKNAIAEKEAEIARLKTAADQAKSTYDNTNPSAADIALSQRYEEIMRQLTAKANELKSEQDRLQALRDALTLHDLTNIGENAYALGTNALATGTNSLAIGTDTIVTGENSIAMGKGSVVTGTNSIAIGTGHNVLGNNSGAFGDPDYIYGDGSYAFGNNNTIGEATNPHNSGNNTFVLGSNVVTKANNAVIIGANSTDGGDNTVSVGSTTAQRKIVHVADGTISQTSKDAINGSQIYDILQNATDINVASWQAKLGTSTTTPDIDIVDGTNTTVTKTTTNNKTTFSVNVANDTIKSAIQSDLDAKANIDASNINATKFAQKLGTGTVSADDTHLVTGKTVYTAIQQAAINGADVSNKANRSANNLTAQDVENWQAKLGTNEVKANSKQLITSGAVHSYVHDMTRNTLAQANTYTDMRINGLQQHTDKQIKRIKGETRAGIASAMAMGAIPTVSNKRYSVGAGTATFRGESAVAIGLRVKSDKDNAVVSFSASASSNGDIAGAAGFAFGF